MRWLGILGLGETGRNEFTNAAKVSPQDLVTDIRDKEKGKPKDTNLGEFEV